MARLPIQIDWQSKRFGEVPVWQAVETFVRPRTAAGRNSFMEAVATRQLDLPFVRFHTADGGGALDGTTGPAAGSAPSAETTNATSAAASAASLPACLALPLVPEPNECGRDRLGTLDAHSDNAATPSGRNDAPYACGPTTYFVSYAWSYTLDQLVGMLERHYRGLPGALVMEGLTPVEYYIPVYYWVDIFAVTQHFQGDFKDHPDSDFPGVIRSAQAVLFTLHPLERPTTFGRVWCLFEAMTALRSGVPLEMLLESNRRWEDAPLASGDGDGDGDGGCAGGGDGGRDGARVMTGGDGDVRRTSGGASGGSAEGDGGNTEMADAPALAAAESPCGGGNSDTRCDAAGCEIRSCLPALAPPLPPVEVASRHVQPPASEEIMTLSFCPRLQLRLGGSGDAAGRAAPRDYRAAFRAGMAAFKQRMEAAAARRRDFPPDEGSVEERDALVDELVATLVALGGPATQAAAREWRLAHADDGRDEESSSSSSSKGGDSSSGSGGGEGGEEEGEEEEEEDDESEWTEDTDGRESGGGSEEEELDLTELIKLANGGADPGAGAGGDANCNSNDVSNGIGGSACGAGAREDDGDGHDALSSGTCSSSHSASSRSAARRARMADWPVSRRAAEAAVSSLDVEQAQASVRSDYDFILGLIQEALGVEAFNRVLKQQLQLRFMEQLLVQAWCAGDAGAATRCLQLGARGLSPVLDIALPSPAAARTCSASLLAALPRSSGLRDLRIQASSLDRWSRYRDGDAVAFAIAEALVASTNPGDAVGLRSGGEEGKEREDDYSGGGGDSNGGCAVTLRSLTFQLPVGPLGCEALGEALRRNTRLEGLSLMGHYFGEQCVAPLFAALAEGNRSIRRLRLLGGNLGRRGVEGLCGFVRACPSLETLELINGALTDEELPLLVDAILASPARSLQHLSLFQNMLTPACGPALERLLSETSTLRVLDVGTIGSSGIGAKGYEAVARGLARNASLVELRCADLGPAGARALREVLCDPGSACRGSLRVLVCGRRGMR